jgi:hypothetical protein
VVGLAAAAAGAVTQGALLAAAAVTLLAAGALAALAVARAALVAALGAGACVELGAAFAVAAAGAVAAAFAAAVAAFEMARCAGHFRICALESSFVLTHDRIYMHAFRDRESVVFAGIRSAESFRGVQYAIKSSITENIEIRCSLMVRTSGSHP